MVVGGIIPDLDRVNFCVFFSKSSTSKSESSAESFSFFSLTSSSKSASSSSACCVFAFFFDLDALAQSVPTALIFLNLQRVRRRYTGEMRREKREGAVLTGLSVSASTPHQRFDARRLFFSAFSICCCLRCSSRHCCRLHRPMHSVPCLGEMLAPENSNNE